MLPKSSSMETSGAIVFFAALLAVPLVVFYFAWRQQLGLPPLEPPR